MTSAVYIGAGRDIDSIIALPNIELFVYIDIFPSTVNRYGGMTRAATNQSMNNFIDSMSSIGLELTEQYENKLIFKSPTQTVLYYINCSFPECLTDELLYVLSTCNIIFIKGFFPSDIILNLIQPNPILIGSYNSCYDVEEAENDDDINVLLWHHPEYIQKYYMLNHDNILEPVENLQELEAIRRARHELRLQLLDELLDDESFEFDYY